MDTTPLLGPHMPSGNRPASSYHRIYTYWLRRGWLCIVVSQLCDLFISALMLLLFTFLSGAIHYDALWFRVKHTECPGESPIRNTAPLYEVDCWGKQVIDARQLAHMHPILAFVVITCVLLWCATLVKIILDIPMLLSVRNFYRKKLKVEDSELNTLPWHDIMNRLVITSNRTELQIIHCITRVDDFDTGLFNDNVLTPFVWGVAYLPDDLRWYIHYVLRSSMDCPTSAMLTMQFRWIAIASFIASPVIMVHRIALFVFRYADEWKRRPSMLASRKWSPWARAKLRNYCELPHDVDARLNKAEKSAQKFLQYGSSELISILARTVILLCGGILSVNVAMAFVYDEEYITLDLTPGRSVAFWMGVAGVLMTGANAFIPSERIEESDHLQHYRDMVRHLQCDVEKDELQSLYQYRIVLMLQVVFSAFLTPIVLLWFISPQSEEIARYLRENTRMCPLAGPVCRHALFEMESMAGGDKVQTSLIGFRKQYKKWRTENEWQNSVMESITLE